MINEETLDLDGFARSLFLEKLFALKTTKRFLIFTKQQALRNRKRLQFTRIVHRLIDELRMLADDQKLNNL